MRMRLIYKMFLLVPYILFSSCTKNSEIIDKYKIWAPYFSKVDLSFYSQNRQIIDTLYFTDLDRDDIKSYSPLYTTTTYEEHMFCIQKSKVFKNLSFSTSLKPPARLWFAIVLDDKGTYFDIDLTQDENNLTDKRIKYFNECTINSKMFSSVYVLSDSLRGLKLYYSPKGIVGYVINNDTMSIENKN